MWEDVCIRSCSFSFLSFVFGLSGCAGMSVLKCITDLVPAAHSCDAAGHRAGCFHDANLAQHSLVQAVPGDTAKVTRSSQILVMLLMVFMLSAPPV